MTDFSDLVEDYSTTPVPPGKTVSGFRVALVVIGTSVALPAFLSGAKIATALGLKQAILAFLAAGALLSVLGCFASYVGSKTRLTTYLLVQFAFGSAGAKFVNMLLVSTMFGWFGVNAYMFAQACQSMIADLSGFNGSIDAYLILGSALMVVTTIFGFKALNKVALFAVPLLALILGCVLVMSITHTSLDALLARRSGEMSFGIAVSAVAGGNMVSVAAMPDLARFMAGKLQVIWSMFLSFTIGSTLIFISAAVPSLATGNTDLIQIIIGLGMGAPAMVVLILSTWTCNGANLYGAGLGLAATFRNIPQWQFTVGAGVMGTLIAMLGIVDHFIPFLLILGIGIPPIAGIYVACYFLYPARMKDVGALESLPSVSVTAFAAWAFGLAVAAATSQAFFTLTTIPSCDALLASTGLYALLERAFGDGACRVAADVPPESTR